MATNKLMEAAADILSGSKAKAPAMPPEKLDGEMEVVGGPTPQNYKQDDDSAKLKVSGKVDKSEHNRSTIKAKPSAASGDTQLKLGGGKKEMHEEIELISDEDFDSLSEEDQSLYLDYLQEMEQLNELSPETLGRYAKKAKKQQGEIGAVSSNRKLPTNIRRQAAGKWMSREGGIERAKEKKGDAVMAQIGAKARQMRNEEFDSSEDIDALFADDSTISEEFKSKATTIFEARVHDRVSQIQEQIESEYAGMLEEAVEQIKEDLTTKVDDYLNYVVEQWLEQNEIAIESGLRSELTEEFIAGLRNLFAEHYIDVPAEKVDLVDELANKVEELESKLDEEIERGVELKKALIESRKVEIAHVVCEGLTDTQVEKIKTLAESVGFSTEEEYADKLETIRENYFPSGVKKADVKQLHEQVEDGSEDKKTSYDPFVAAVSQAISKTKF